VLNTPFTLYMTSLVLTTLASTMLSVAVGWHIYEATGDPFDLALVGLMQILPMAGLFLVSGWVIDNLQRKYILIACTLLQAGVLLGLSVSFTDGGFDRVAVFSLLLLNGIGRTFYMPATQAVLPAIVPRESLSRAVAVNSTVWTAAGTAGPFAAGFLVAWFDTGVYRMLAAPSFLAGFLFLLLPAAPVRRSVGRGVEQLLEGVRYVLRNPLVLPAISLDLFIVLVGSVVALLPVYAVDVLTVGPEALGLMRAMPALGAVAAGIVLTRLPAMRRTGALLYASLAIFAVSILVFAVSTSLWLSLAALLVYGASDMVSVNVRTTIIQLATPDELRGRVNSVNSLFIATSNDMGDFRAGSVATLLGPVGTVLVGGLMAIGVVAGGYLLSPALRRLDRITDARQNAGSPELPRNP